MKGKKKITKTKDSGKSTPKKEGISSKMPTSSKKVNAYKLQLESGLAILRENESHYTIQSRIREIGNSKGVILSNRVIEEAGFSVEADLLIHASEGIIIIQEVKNRPAVNTDLSTWDAQFKKAIKEGRKPEGDLWGHIENSFDKEEWT